MLKILLASSEVHPFAKTGGLADVAGALPKALRKLGHEVYVVMPAYRSVKAGTVVQQNLSVQMGGQTKKFSVRQALFPDSNVPIYLIDHKPYFDRDELYQDKGKDYPDNPERFAFFCLATLELLKKLNWAPDVIHCNDWQTALLPVYLKTTYKNDPFFKHTATVFTIHNLAYQGLAAHSKLHAMSLEEKLFNPHALEFYGKVNLLKGGLVFADLLNTVSKNYSEEIQTKEFGCGLEGLLHTRKRDLFGILNGLDYAVWDPEFDNDLIKKYSAHKLVDKKPNKEDLQKLFKLPVLPMTPVIGMVSRLDTQKGFDLLVQAMDRIMALNVQLVVLGTGTPEYHVLFEKLHHKYPNQIGIALKFDAALAKKIYAGSDMFLMPSRYEPCGLGQLISLKYGTVPIVRETGGLADTIVDYYGNKRSGNGFTFKPYTAEDLLDTVRRAALTFREKTAWTKLMSRAMLEDFSWNASAKHYARLYKKAAKLKDA
ncbi:MAG: glycogen synthase GlgA [Candidatus Margulisiibacteriota bacterium]|jgi:starch synthase